MEIKGIDPRQLLDALQEGVAVYGESAEILYANPKALELLRLTEEQALGSDAPDAEWCFIDTHRNVMAHQEFPVNRVLREKRALNNIEIGICDSSTDQITWVLCNAFPQFDFSGCIEKVVLGLLDISSKKTDIPFGAIISNANDIVLVTEATPIKGDGPRIVYVNQAFCRLTGYTPSEVIGKTPRILQGDDTSIETRRNIRKALELKQPVRETILNYSKSGMPYWLEMNIFPLENTLGEVSYFAAVERDITEQVENENRLKELATEDPLTGLLNRKGFFDLARKRLSGHADEEASTIAMIDIDHFKKVNDSFGHDCGDRTLIFLASHLRAAFRESDLVCRFGGEEFVVLVFGVDASIARKKFEKFRKKISDSPFDIGNGNTITITVSIGIKEISSSLLSIEAGLKEADRALYHAKGTGRNRVAVAD